MRVQSPRSGEACKQPYGGCLLVARSLHLWVCPERVTRIASLSLLKTLFQTAIYQNTHLQASNVYLVDCNFLRSESWSAAFFHSLKFLLTEQVMGLRATCIQYPARGRILSGQLHRQRLGQQPIEADFAGHLQPPVSAADGQPSATRCKCAKMSSRRALKVFCPGVPCKAQKRLTPTWQAGHNLL